MAVTSRVHRSSPSSPSPTRNGEGAVRAGRSASGVIAWGLCLLLVFAWPASAQTPPVVGDSVGGSDGSTLAQPPRVTNPDEVAAALDRHYPPQLRAQRISGTTVLRLKVDRIGLPYDVEVASSAGHPWFDEAAKKVVEAVEFEPGLRGGEPAEYTIELPLRFQVEMPPELQGLTFCENPPRLVNRPELMRILKEEVHRGELPDREAMITAWVDSGGEVWNVELLDSSGSVYFDQLALALGSFMEFLPGTEDGEPTPSLVSVPVGVQVR